MSNLLQVCSKRINPKKLKNRKKKENNNKKRDHQNISQEAQKL